MACKDGLGRVSLFLFSFSFDIQVNIKKKRGKGLGKNEDGRLEYVKVSIKKDTKGVCEMNRSFFLRF